MNYYFLSHITRIFLAKLRKHHANEEPLLVFSKDFIGEEVFAYGCYEKYEIETISKVLDFDTSQHHALDIGANIGNHSRAFSGLFKTVLCFEPHPTIFEVLQLNTKHKDNVKCYNFGLSSEQKNAFLEIPKYNLGGGSITNIQTQHTIPIALKKGDDFLTQPCSFVKIDVEGHESEVIKGMQKFLEQHKPIICFELINEEVSGSKIITLLKEIGYTHFYVPYHKSLFPYLKRKRFFVNFIDGILFKKSHQLISESQFNNAYYNQIFCESEASSFRLKKKFIKK
ncbi:MAG: FkbM family methyltransferase [Flavobacteriaceae bacterium]